jgi:pimeloyl-ACP methyl ester carboxylesterase
VIGPVLYLHGFASSSSSTKGGYFAKRLREHGIALRCPDFNEPDFATMTMTRMMEHLRGELDGGEPAVLIGSSLGGTLAILAAARLADRIERLVLLAPAVMFGRPDQHLVPPERVEEWRRAGELSFFHYADGRERPLNYAFYEDSLQYDAAGSSFAQPAIVFQGTRDRTVEPRTVIEFSERRPNVTLSLLDDDHQLMASLPAIWNGMAQFLGLAAA